MARRKPARSELVWVIGVATRMFKNFSSSTLAASATAALALLWLIADVSFVDAGHLSGLFYVGAKAALPSGVLSNNTYRVRDERGYDGEFYYLLAHDPLNQRGYLAYVDTPRYRWRRIGLPALAHLLAFGSDSWVDRIYVALQVLFVFLGSYCLAVYAKRNSLNAAWGAAFLLIPAVAVSLDRMTVDLPLAALCVALLLCTSDGTPARFFYAALIAAPLVRETGMLLILAWCAFWAMHKSLRYVLRGAACALPALGWWLYVTLHTTPDRVVFLTGVPLSGLIAWTAHALTAPVAACGPRANAVLELAAVGGVWLAFVLAAYLAVRRGLRGIRDLPELIALVFAAFASLIGNQEAWASAYGICRTLSPLLIGLAAIALRDRRPLFMAPLLLAVPRIALQYAAEIKTAVRGLS